MKKQSEPFPKYPSQTNKSSVASQFSLTNTNVHDHSGGAMSGGQIDFNNLANKPSFSVTFVPPRVFSITTGDPTFSTDDYDACSMTEIAGNIAFQNTNITGSPVDFQILKFRLLDNGAGPYSLSWDTNFKQKGVPLPTTTVSNKCLTVGFLYDSIAAVWGCVAAARET